MKRIIEYYSLLRRSVSEGGGVVGAKKKQGVIDLINAYENIKLIRCIIDKDSPLSAVEEAFCLLKAQFLGECLKVIPKVVTMENPSLSDLYLSILNQDDLFSVQEDRNCISHSYSIDELLGKDVKDRVGNFVDALEHTIGRVLSDKYKLRAEHNIRVRKNESSSLIDGIVNNDVLKNLMKIRSCLKGKHDILKLNIIMLLKTADLVVSGVNKEDFESSIYLQSFSLLLLMMISNNLKRYGDIGGSIDEMEEWEIDEIRYTRNFIAHTRSFSELPSSDIIYDQLLFTISALSHQKEEFAYSFSDNLSSAICEILSITQDQDLEEDEKEASTSEFREAKGKGRSNGERINRKALIDARNRDFFKSQANNSDSKKVSEAYYLERLEAFFPSVGEKTNRKDKLLEIFRIAFSNKEITLKLMSTGRNAYNPNSTNKLIDLAIKAGIITKDVIHLKGKNIGINQDGSKEYIIFAAGEGSKNDLVKTAIGIPLTRRTAYKRSIDFTFQDLIMENLRGLGSYIFDVINSLGAINYNFNTLSVNLSLDGGIQLEPFAHIVIYGCSADAIRAFIRAGMEINQYCAVQKLSSLEYVCFEQSFSHYRIYELIKMGLDLEIEEVKFHHYLNVMKASKSATIIDLFINSPRMILMFDENALKKLGFILKALNEIGRFDDILSKSDSSANYVSDINNIMLSSDIDVVFKAIVKGSLSELKKCAEGIDKREFILRLKKVVQFGGVKVSARKLAQDLGHEDIDRYITSYVLGQRYEKGLVCRSDMESRGDARMLAIKEGFIKKFGAEVVMNLRRIIEELSEVDVTELFTGMVIESEVEFAAMGADIRDEVHESIPTQIIAGDGASWTLVGVYKQIDEVGDTKFFTNMLIEPGVESAAVSANILSRRDDPNFKIFDISDTYGKFVCAYKKSKAKRNEASTSTRI